MELRWTCLEKSLMLPHVITLESMKQVADFAEGELSCMALQGSKSGNPGLPLTDQQKTQIENNKKPAVAIAASATLDAKGKGRAKVQTNKGAGGHTGQPDGKGRLSTTTSGWAKPCSWWNKGSCTRGISCLFKHDGIPTTDGRCYICGVKGHGTNQCTAPGGGADPKRDEHWTANRQRRDKAHSEDGKGSKGKQGDRENEGGTCPKQNPAGNAVGAFEDSSAPPLNARTAVAASACAS